MKVKIVLAIAMMVLPIMIGIILIFGTLHQCRKEMIKWFYSTSSAEILTLLSKITWRCYFESHLRAQTGKPLERPFGTPLHYYSWNQILVQPDCLLKKPVDQEIPFGTTVILGPQALRPLSVKNPILIGGMAYGGALSVKAKIALAKAATMFGTAANSGSGPFLNEERAAAEQLIFQYSRGFWAKSQEILSQAEMIEISLGHGAWSSAPVRIKGEKVVQRYARDLRAVEGLDILIEARLTEVESLEDWKKLILYLKEITNGVPIAVKIGATHHLEEELALILEGDIDIIVIDGTEGGSHSVPPILSDDVGLPTLPALCRSSQFLKERKLKNRISLIIGGGLYTPGDFLKCLALGADAVIIGTIAALAVSHTQITHSIPWEPPTGLVYYGGKSAHQFNPDLGAKNLYHYLQSCILEMEQTVRAMGKRSFQELDKSDLVAMEPLYSEITGIHGVTWR